MLNRRTFNGALMAALGSRTARAQGKYKPAWESLRQHQVPAWYQDAKLGIFIHWGLYSVPAWAPTTGELGKIPWDKWFVENPYAEWYLNTLRIKDSPTYRHHVETYGKDFDYYQFAKTFNEKTAGWNPDVWAKLFQQTGARYVVLTTKHHDGFTLWPSATPNPKRPGQRLAASRDLAGDLARSVRAHGMKMGFYYSGGLDWTFTSEPIRNREDLRARVPQTPEYAHYTDAHWEELIHRYKPSVMWNDINYPKLGAIPQLFADYYNTVPEGVINNRFGVDFADFTTPEYAKYDKVTEKKWEACRGLGFSFGYNQNEGPEQVIAPDKLIALFVDIVSNNGNLLLNIGPRADGTISDIQTDRLNKLGAWLHTNGEGVFGTRPWTGAGAHPETVKFTQKGNVVYAFLVDRPSGQTVRVPGLTAASGSRVRILGMEKDSEWKQSGADLMVSAPSSIPGEYAVGVRVITA